MAIQHVSLLGQWGTIGKFWKNYRYIRYISTGKKVPICTRNGNTAAETKELHTCICSMMNYFILATCIFIFCACVCVNNSLHYHFINVDINTDSDQEHTDQSDDEALTPVSQVCVVWNLPIIPSTFIYFVSKDNYP